MIEWGAALNKSPIYGSPSKYRPGKLICDILKEGLAKKEENMQQWGEGGEITRSVELLGLIPPTALPPYTADTLYRTPLACHPTPVKDIRKGASSHFGRRPLLTEGKNMEILFHTSQIIVKLEILHRATQKYSAVGFKCYTQIWYYSTLIPCI